MTAPPERLQVLLIEDRPADAELMVRELQKAGFDPDWQRIESERDLRLRLTPNLDLILADYTIPGFGALPALHVMRDSGLDIPFLVVSGSLGDEKAAECLKLGATDYILKDRMARLGPAVRRALQEHKTRKEKLQAEAALRASEERMRGILSTVEDVVWSVSVPDWKVLFLSPPAERLFGRPVASFHDDPDLWIGCVHPDDRPLALAARETALKWGAAEHECRIVRPDGSVRIAAVRTWTAYGADRKPTRLEGILTDVTDRHQAEEAARARWDFLANMSHEILTPLHGVLGLSRLLKQEDLPPSQSGMVEDILLSAEYLAARLNHILDISKMDSGPLEIQKAPFDVRAFVEETFRMAAPATAGKALELRCQVGPEVPGQVLGDAVRVRQVLLNLLSNAIKFTAVGFVLVSVEAAQGPKGMDLRFTVRDTGQGIPPDRRAHLLHLFGQAGPAASRTPGGTGLGLASSKRIVEAMGGRLWLDPDATTGTVFHFSIPSGAAPAPAPGSPAPPAAAKGGPPRILVVDDSVVNQRLLARMLERLGHGCAVASNGQEAVLAARSGAYDLVLMDLRMPVMDGLEAARAIRDELGPKAPRMVAITADAMPGDRGRCLEAGLADYFTKPLHLETLAAILQASPKASS